MTFIAWGMIQSSREQSKFME